MAFASLEILGDYFDQNVDDYHRMLSVVSGVDLSVVADTNGLCGPSVDVT